jgi:hypothetical protein
MREIKEVVLAHIAAIINSYKHNGLRQCKFILYSSEGQKSKSDSLGKSQNISRDGSLWREESISISLASYIF